MWEKPTATAIAMVFKGKLFIKVGTHIKAKDDMRGRVQKSLYMSYADYNKGIEMVNQLPFQFIM